MTPLIKYNVVGVTGQVRKGQAILASFSSNTFSGSPELLYKNSGYSKVTMQRLC